MSRHFVWLTPLVNLLVFLSVGLCLAGLTRIWPRMGAWLSPRFLCALALLPMFIVAGRQIYPEASLLLALGIAAQVVAWRAHLPAETRRWLTWSFPALLAVVMILAASLYVGDALKRRTEAGRPLPPAGSRNVLLVVLDTVRADRLSLYGYQRPTTPALERLAKGGIRFDAARPPLPGRLRHTPAFSAGAGPMNCARSGKRPSRQITRC